MAARQAPDPDLMAFICLGPIHLCSKMNVDLTLRLYKWNQTDPFVTE